MRIGTKIGLKFSTSDVAMGNYFLIHLTSNSFDKPLWLKPQQGSYPFFLFMFSRLKVDFAP